MNGGEAAHPINPFTTDSKTIAGMIHVPALPGTPRASMPMKDILTVVRAEASLLRELGFDAFIIENMHDRPYQSGSTVPSEIVASMTVVASEAREAAGIPGGVQVLAAANHQSLAVAVAADLDFIRVEGFVFGHIADEGLIESDAASLLRKRKELGAENIAILTDIKKKHAAHAITADVDLSETAQAARFFLSDGLIVTGTSTGRPTDLAELREVAEAVPDLPTIVGSGITPDSAAAALEIADGLIVGSALKENGHWENPIDPARARTLIEAARTSPRRP